MRSRTKLETLKLARDPITKAIILALWRDKAPFKVIEFETATPGIEDYSVYEDRFGVVPDVRMYTEDALGNWIPRPELPYYIRLEGKIVSIVFTAIVNGVQIPLVDGVQKGFIVLRK